MNRIDQLFIRARQERRVALLPYLTAGYPERDSALELLPALVRAGADGIELGIPFSDPIADGPSIQRSTAGALRNGMTVGGSLSLLGNLRALAQVPIIPMGYYNPFLQYGAERLCQHAAEHGADGLIVPDLPLHEAATLSEMARRFGLHLVLFIAPTSTDERLRRVGELASGFVYCVSLRGVTGARSDLSHDLDVLLDRARAYISQPIVVGFGISKPEHVAHLHGRADGAIVASAIVDLLDRTAPNDRAAAVEVYTRTLVEAGQPTPSA